MSTEAQKNNTTTTVVGKNKLVVDREKTVPFLLRIFWRQGHHHRPDDYTPEHLPTENEVQIYTWKDATLKEIANLFREVNAEANKPNARLSFKLVYLDNLRGKYVLKDLGAVHNLSPSSDHDTNLDDARFVIGDFLDVAIFHGAPPRSIERRNSLWRDRNRDRDRDRGGRNFRGIGNDRERERNRDRDRDRDRDRERDRDRDRYRDRNGGLRADRDRRDDRRDRNLRDRRR
ncbi:hypothetical protein Glove_218g12 [Diversispora epigaea]|uniref:Histone deacetylase complex subunit SAP18 n=1 Tax=Diversispora epigaea TaxID=1348612 RepID=A0A397IJG7_9GLOM|nr:hypothetical protein Glove_218g12 [Diversispora epigaea]